MWRFLHVVGFVRPNNASWGAKKNCMAVFECSGRKSGTKKAPYPQIGRFCSVIRRRHPNH
jgi:hypothetical protein